MESLAEEIAVQVVMMDDENGTESVDEDGIPLDGTTIWISDDQHGANGKKRRPSTVIEVKKTKSMEKKFEPDQHQEDVPKGTMNSESSIDEEIGRPNEENVHQKKEKEKENCGRDDQIPSAEEGTMTTSTQDSSVTTSTSSTAACSSSSDETASPKVRNWLHGLRWRAELETMYVLYAKSIPTNNAQVPYVNGGVVDRVPLCDRPPSMSKSDSEQATSAAASNTHSASMSTSQPSLLADASPPVILRRLKKRGTQHEVEQPQEDIDANVQESGDQDPPHHHRSTVCLSASTASPSLVMSRQSVVIVPGGAETSSEGVVWAEARLKGRRPRREEEEADEESGTLTKFAVSLPNRASLGERLASTERRREWTPPAGRRRRDGRHKVMAEEATTTMDYSELPLCEPNNSNNNGVYQPNIKYRRNRRGGGGLPSRRRKGSSPFSTADSSLGLSVRPVAFRHSIRVNPNDDAAMPKELADMGIGNNHRNFLSHTQMSMSMFCSNNKFGVGLDDDSPVEGSLDSGQGSGGSPPFFNNFSTLAAIQRHRYHQFYHGRRFSDEATDEDCVSSVEGRRKMGGKLTRKLPSYAKTANCIAQVLRLSSTIFGQLGDHRGQKCVIKLLDNTKAYISLLSECPCSAHMPQSELDLVRRAMRDTERELIARNVQHNDYLAVCIRRLLEQSLQVFVILISQYLSECANHDRLLLIALEQLVHLLLFGDELCLEAIRHNAVDNVLGLALMPLTGADTLKLLLRTLQLLCGTAKGCLQMLSIGGLDLVLRVLRNSAHADCSIEAAGCLAQLCSPAHCFLRLTTQSLQPLVPRLLQLVDRCPSPESLLLCLAALANLSGHNAGPVAELLYTHNAVRRLVRAAQRGACADNLFVQEELVTLLTRMANRGFERALASQGAIPILCHLLQLEGIGPNGGHNRHGDFQRRVAYKAAVCLGTLASSGAGLRALYEQGAHKILSGAFRSEYGGGTTAPPIQLICASIRQRLENTYHLETAV